MLEVCEMGGGSSALAEKTRWTRLNSGGIQAGETQRGRHSIGRCGISRRSKEGSSTSESRLEF